MISDADITEYRRWRQQHQPCARHVVTHGLFGPVAEVVAITEFPPLITRANGAVHVAATGTQLTLPAYAEHAVADLLFGNPVCVAEVSATRGVDASKIADVLLEEGLCAEVTAALRSGCSGLVPAGISSHTL